MVQQQLLPIEYLIGAPLEAVVRAQAMAARTTAEFVGEVGFETDEKGNTRARMVDFEYVHPRADPDNPGQVIDTPTRVRVPLLTLLSVPSVAIDEASVEFQVRIAGQQQVDSKPTAERPVLERPLQPRPVAGPSDGLNQLLPTSRLRMVGAVTAPKLAEQSASLKVSIKLKQVPAPEGLSQVLGLLSDATTARPSDGR